MLTSLRSRASAALFVSTSLLLVSAGCSSSSHDDDTEQDESAQTDINPSLFRQTAPWTGRLILPSANERRPDGAVKLEIHNSPDASLVHQTIWLRLDLASADVAERARSVTRSIAFNELTRKSIQKGNVHPVRLDGWQNVSPLESLAGAHPEDDVLVALPPGAKVTNEGGALPSVTIGREPTIVAGDYVALIKLLSPTGTPSASAASTPLEVKHYKKTTRDFDGPAETLLFDAPAIPVGGNGAVLSPLAGLDQSDDNRLAGYYAHAVRGADGKLHVRALVPRQLRNVPTINIRNGASASLLYTTAGMWDPIADIAHGKQAKGSSAMTLLVPNGHAGEAAAAAWSSGALDTGTKLLVVHAFGAIGPNEDGPLRTGHFAFGIGTIVQEPLTGERALDIEYKQIYAHNPNGIIAGSHDYASYAGSFARGWMYSRPLADVALYLPALNRTYSLGGSISLPAPIDALGYELEAMTARYRTGLGTGAAIVTPANSCVQDSSKALYFALAKLDEKTSSAEGAKAFLASHPDDAEVKDYKTLLALADEVEHYLSPLGFTRADWKDQAGKLAATDVNACAGGLFGAVFCGLGSWKTIVPRRASDFYTEVLLRNGAGGIAVRTNDIGAMPGIVPLSPTTLLR